MMRREEPIEGALQAKLKLNSSRKGEERNKFKKMLMTSSQKQRKEEQVCRIYGRKGKQIPCQHCGRRKSSTLQMLEMT